MPQVLHWTSTSARFGAFIAELELENIVPKYKQFKPDRINDYPLKERDSKIDTSNLGVPFRGGSFSDFISSLPQVLAAEDIRNLAQRIHQARLLKKPIIWGLGGHVFKVGLTPILLELMRNGFITAIATNGSGLIHDFEIAFAGTTSEDVESQLATGSFGMAKETSEAINQGIELGARNNIGIGEALGRFLENYPLENPELSLCGQAYNRDIPFTAHIAYGTDITHSHPSSNGAATGHCAQIDFGVFTEQIRHMHQGGVYLNVGSAVLLPEVFLKSVAVVRNSGYALSDFTTANLDFIQHYRPTQNVIRRPISGEGTGIAITGHHEIVVPLLAAILLDSDLSPSPPNEDKST